MALLFGAAARELRGFNSVRISLGALQTAAGPFGSAPVSKQLREGLGASLPKFFSFVQSYSL